MFGKAGCLARLKVMGKDGWQKSLLAWLHGGYSRVVGIYPGKEKLYFMELGREGEDWQVVRLAEEVLAEEQEAGIQAGFGSVQISGQKRLERIRLWAEGVKMRLAREGWEKMPLALCLPDGLGFSCLTALPLGMEGEELREAAYWELEGKLLEEEPGLELAEMYWDFAPLGGAGQNYLLTAVEKPLIDSVRHEFRVQGMELAYLTLPMPDLQSIRADKDSLWLGGTYVKLAPLVQLLPLEALRPAFYAAAGAVCLGDRNWPGAMGQRASEKWNYKGLALSWLTLVSCMLLGVLASDICTLYEAKTARDQAQQELAELSDARQQMELLESVRQDTERKEAQLAELSAHSYPWYSLLVHFGGITVPGAWIDGLKLEAEDSLSLSGQAVDFGTLADFIRAFEQDTEFFPDGPVLESSGVQEKGQGVSFTLHLKL